jgi:phosphoribosylformimino-5-aminoimidazole carboxamide ribotide isomerase
MLIPSIDLQGGKIVQLVQGERLAIATDDVDEWVRKFAAYPKVQLIDLDAAKGVGSNESLVQHICGLLPCRVGGGIRSVERAEAMLSLGAKKVILSSALFRENQVDQPFAKALLDRIGADRLIAAVDGKGGKVVIHGWRTSLELTPEQAISQLEPFFGEFLYTHVDLEGLMRGTNMGVIRSLRAATVRSLTAAGGITTREEITELDAMGVDAVVGMAVYTGKLKI